MNSWGERKWDRQKKRTRLRDVVDTWKDKCVDQEKITFQKEDRIRNLTDDMREKKRAISTLEKLVERGTMLNGIEVDGMKHARVDGMKQDKTRLQQTETGNTIAHNTRQEKQKFTASSF